ncbi:hypothetical protein GCM10010912_19920 [Paenibacillus albidus]|uniref:DUF4025 domain-containing protein n=1 Tax=Paenibacillus albidus TaxID=2041023 RepID=A0A917FEY5_9BACL|nr:hypothetical protein [Paenibacillus albidus]MBT2288534.1 hypothetical protein [Paenibacillus albidus]GGF74714.1 hypothetical protein GCM10010912_19920 [Paenibacillus albidus]
MSKGNKAEQVKMQDSNETAVFQNQAIREFVEDKTGKPGAKGPVSQSTSRIDDDQNRLTSVHNLRK